MDSDAFDSALQLGVTLRVALQDVTRQVANGFAEKACFAESCPTIWPGRLECKHGRFFLCSSRCPF